MAENIMAAFNTGGEALSAARELRRDGFAREAITIMSDEPIEMPEDLIESGKSRIGICAIAGGVIGAVAALALTVITSREVGLVTGGMPIVAPWAFGIIVFEMTALGAILATLGCMIYEAKLVRRGALKQYDAAVADGKVLVAVECESDSSAEAAAKIFAGRGAQVSGGA
ncbi:MAG TPA: quinol:electron acceptor oxidoreductase subunit ActD [Blastocatellia bacterium]|nr:quinol:electron acceptor oxidoreductase subunit ActD [Blastocatellia bacterium]